VRAVRFQDVCAGGRRALRQVVKGEADHWRGIAQPIGIDLQMHRQPVADFHSGLGPNGVHFHSFRKIT